MPVAPSNEKAATAIALKAVNEQLESKLLCMLDDKEDLWEDQELWIGRWKDLLVHDGFSFIRSEERRVGKECA